MRRTTIGILLMTSVALVSGCIERSAESNADPQGAGSGFVCESPHVRAVAERLGESLKEVPLLAPDSIVIAAIREAYGTLVTPTLLERWVDEPSTAPGRDVSSPWPETIEVDSLVAAGEDVCRVYAEVVYATSADSGAREGVFREPVTLEVTRGGWKISAFEVRPNRSEDAAISTAAAAESSQGGAAESSPAADVVRRYYEAVDAGDFAAAYALWEGDGAASGQSFNDFAGGFAETADVTVDVGEPGRVEPAAGSWYVEVPATVRAVTKEGEEQRFEGTYTLRRTASGDTADERPEWRIYSAKMEEAGQ